MDFRDRRVLTVHSLTRKHVCSAGASSSRVGGATFDKDSRQKQAVLESLSAGSHQVAIHGFPQALFYLWVFKRSPPKWWCLIWCPFKNAHTHTQNRNRHPEEIIFPNGGCFVHLICANYTRTWHPGCSGAALEFDQEARWVCCAFSPKHGGVSIFKGSPCWRSICETKRTSHAKTKRAARMEFG